jgi:hypothetical protein
VLDHFEKFNQIVAAGFDASSAPAMLMNKNHKQWGLLIMNNDDLCQIELVLKTKLLIQTAKMSRLHHIPFWVWLWFGNQPRHERIMQSRVQVFPVYLWWIRSLGVSGYVNLINRISKVFRYSLPLSIIIELDCSAAIWEPSAESPALRASAESQALRAST